MEELATYRMKIDEIDEQMQRLFLARMETVRAIAEQKLAQDLPVYDRDREDAVITLNVGRIETSPFSPYYREFLECVMRLAKDFQKVIVKDSL